MESCLKKSIFFLVYLIWASTCLGNVLKVEHGKIDLSSLDLTGSNTVRLEGEWEFYWQALKEPEDFKTENSSYQTALIGVPGSWAADGKYPKHGYASYRAVVTMAEIKQISLHFPPIWSASRVFVDGRMIFEVGQVANKNDPSAYRPGVVEKFYTFTPQSKTFDIVVQATNYEIFLAGFATGAPSLGNPDAISSSRLIVAVESYFVIGCILIMGLYHLVLWCMRTKEKSALYFGFFCVSIGIYLALNQGASSATVKIFPMIKFKLYMSLLNIWGFAPMLFALYVQSLFPDFMSKKFVHLQGILMSTCTVLTMMSDMKVAIWLTSLMLLLTLPICFYCFYVIFKAVKKKVESSRIFLAGMIIITFTTIHDALLGFGILESTPLSGIGALIFVLVQSNLLARRFSSAFRFISVMITVRCAPFNGAVILA